MKWPRLPWWAWLVAGVVLALVVEHVAGLVLAAPAAGGVARRVLDAGARRAGERARTLERAAGELEARHEAVAEERRAVDQAVDDAGDEAADATPGAEKWDRFWRR